MLPEQRHLVQSSWALAAARGGELDDPDAMVPRLAALGRRHAAYGVHESHYATVGEALLHALGTTLGDALPADARTAWADAYALIGAVMRRATTYQHSL